MKDLKTEHTTSQSLIPIMKATLTAFLDTNRTYTSADWCKCFKYDYNGQSREGSLLHGSGFAEISVEIQNKQKRMLFWTDESDDAILNESRHFKELLSNQYNLQDIAEKLADRILGWELEEEGYGPWVEIPNGTVYIGELIIDDNRKRWRSEKPEGAVIFSLEKYNHIGTLIIPASVQTADFDSFSFFAGEEAKPFVSAGETKYRRIRIDRIENYSRHLRVEDGVLYSGDMTKLIYCFKEKHEFDVPETVTRICPYAFCGQQTLERVTLHNSLLEIGRNAFMDCRMLREIRIPDGVTEIKPCTFDNCLALENIVLPDGLTSLGYDAFRHCEALEMVDLPDSIEEMRSFECCFSLKEISVPRKVKVVDGFMFCRSLRYVRLGEGVQNISGYAFRYCENLEKINFPEGLQTIGTRAFMPNGRLSKVQFPSTLTEIGIEAFCQCRRLRSVRFCSNVKNIGEAAFACTSFFLQVSKPEGMTISADVFKYDEDMDKWGFWD